MKRVDKILTAAALALTVLTAAPALAQPYGPPPGPPPGGYGHPFGPPPGAGWHRWHHGDRYDGPRYVVGNWGYYHLPPPPYGYQWVRGDHQYLLLGINTGIVAQVIVP